MNGLGCRARLFGTGLILFALALATTTGAADVVRVATFNVMNYACIDRRIDGQFRPSYPKPEAEKNGVRRVIREIGADILCIQEMGPMPFLEELRHDLRMEGADYPHAVLGRGADAVRHLAVLSRIPVDAVVVHDAIEFAYLDRQEVVKRGLLELRFEGPGGPWLLFVLHLKSPLTEEKSDPRSVLRRAGEARAIRKVIVDRAGGPRGLPFLVAGDFNDGTDSGTINLIQKAGRQRVMHAIPAADSRGETWTHRFAAGDLYQRVDFLFASPLLEAWIRGGRGFVHDGPGALDGSDHRLVWCDLELSAPPEGRSARETETPADEAAGVSESVQN